MRVDRARLSVALAPGLALAGWAVGGLLIWHAAEPDLAPALAGQGGLLLGWLALGATGLGWLALRLHDRLVLAPRRLADAATNLAGNPAAPLLDDPSPLAQAVNRLAENSRALQADMQRQVTDASRKVAQERDQLGALMAELQQSVVVCTLDGRILLYNERARALFQRLSDAPQIAGGADLIGLGRSIHAVIDRPLIDHARETVERHLARGEAAGTARFVTTTAAGHLLQVVWAPVRAEGALTGYVLLLDDITEAQAAQSRRDQRLVALTEASRASLASIQAALDMLDYPDLKRAEHDSFHKVIRDEVTALAARLAQPDADAGSEAGARWPLQDMLGADLLAAASGHLRAGDRPAPQVEQPEEALWLRLDSFALIRSLAGLAAALPAGIVPGLRLAPAATPGWAHLDLSWPQDAVPAEAFAASRPEARAVAERHGGELWLGHDRAAGRAFFRFLLPMAQGQPQVSADPRPEFYDFDLFANASADHGLADSRLDQLAYTVFDTETTGLDPAGGDEIIQIGAVRVLNGKILRGEGFDQLVDPGRSIPEAGIPYHGIRPEMVRGKPGIAEVLPAFHAYAAGTVLVGHNVAFDMRFLQLKEAATGLRFEQPVLDTLLLASIAQPHEPSQSLEAIAERLGVQIAGRHNAAGDAMATAQVFLALLPLLGARGIVTLGEARAAAETSYYARLRY